MKSDCAEDARLRIARKWSEKRSIESHSFVLLARTPFDKINIYSVEYFFLF